MKLFFITRTFPDEKTGGAIIRKGTVENLRACGYDVWIIAPNYSSKEFIINKYDRYILCPIKMSLRIPLVLESFGICDDYLQYWAKDSICYLKDYVTKDDLIFATSGGELGTIMLGLMLKEIVGSKVVVNLHDPIGFTWINGVFLKYYSFLSYHSSRDKLVGNLLEQTDAVVTSSITYKNALENKYHLNNVYSWHFGYINDYHFLKEKEITDSVHIVYGGALGKLQRVDLFLESSVDFPNIEISVVGNYLNNKKMRPFFDKVNFLSPMSQMEYLDFLSRNADVGFLSLDGIVSELCVPSKFYEYINLGIPILAIIKGDTKNIILEFDYGVVADFSRQSIRNALGMLVDKGKRQIWKNNIIRDRNNWSMECQIKNLVKILSKVVSL